MATRLQSRVGDRPAYQYIGQSTGILSLSGTLLLAFTGGQLDLHDI
jgi:phage protein U